MYDALIVTNKMSDKARVLRELGLEHDTNILVKSKNENTFSGLMFKQLILAPDFMFENDEHYNLVDRLMLITKRYNR